MTTASIAAIPATQWASQIYDIMQAAYHIEGQLLGVTDFFPLKRPIQEIAASGNDFVGFFQADTLLGVCELEKLSDDSLLIASMVVSPRAFRQGIASALLKHVLDTAVEQTIEVSTGEDNLPAVQLYQKHGFTITQRRTLPDGLKLVILQYTKLTTSNH